MSGCFLRHVVGAETNDLDKRHGTSKKFRRFIRRTQRLVFVPTVLPSREGEKIRQRRNLKDAFLYILYVSFLSRIRQREGAELDTFYELYDCAITVWR